MLLSKKSKTEAATTTPGAFDPDIAAMLFDNFLALRQTNPRTGEIFPPVQALENQKYTLSVRLVNTNTVIFHTEFPATITGLSVNFNTGNHVVLNVLQTVANQVLKQHT
jgi:hypothetical protein